MPNGQCLRIQLGSLARGGPAGIVYATLVPAGWQIRSGLHWLVEHFLAYFAVTAIFCLAWPRPMVVAAVLLPFAVLLETLQGLTPDRAPDPATGLSAATGVAVAALLADLIIALRKGRASAHQDELED